MVEYIILLFTFVLETYTENELFKQFPLPFWVIIFFVNNEIFYIFNSDAWVFYENYNDV